MRAAAPRPRASSHILLCLLCELGASRRLGGSCPSSETKPPRSVDEPHVPEVGHDGGGLVDRAIAGGPVDEEGFAEQKALGHPAGFHLQFLVRQVDVFAPVAAVLTDQRVVSAAKKFVGAEADEIVGEV